MKRIKNADINFKLNPKRINLNNFSMKLYTVNSEAYFFIKDQDNVVSVEREATIYDDPEVIISGGTVAVDYYLPLDWSELVQLGEGVLNYRCINNIDDPFFPDLVYNQVVEDTTAYYIDSDIHIDPADDKNLIERVVELESNLAVETADREDADVFLSGAVDTEIARAISAETELSERIDAIESGASEALDAEIERAISAETALQDAIDDEEARAIAIENAIRQDLTDESELRSSADTAMWTAINDETTRATSAETAIENKVDVETLRAIGVENAISGDLQTYKATNNAALQAETTRATSAETALQTAIQNEATARANADAALGTRIDNISSASTAAIEAEEARAREAESGLTTALQNEVTRATSAETQLSNSLTTEINRATSAETAIDNKIDAETLRAIGVENTISGNLETYKATANAALQTETTRATSAETALQTAIDNEATARANADTALQTAITNEESRAREAESAITNALNAEVTRATGAESALDAKANTVSGNVITETTRATTAENALSGAIDTLDVRFFDNAKYENSGNTKVINFYNAGVVKATIDATDFIKDGMIDSVELETKSGTTYLVITWNTDAGKQKTELNIGDLFEADNYYDKTAIDGIVSGINTSIADEISARTDADTALSNRIAAEASARTDADTAINGKIDVLSGAIDTKLAISDFNTYSGNVNTAINGKLAISDFNAYSAATDTLINSKASQSTVDALSGTVTGHTSDNVIHVTSSDKEKWNKIDDKADTTAVTAAIDAAVSGKANSSDVYLKTETSGATELSNALAQKLAISDFNIYSGAVDTALSGKADTATTYTKSETDNAITAATSTKQDTLVSSVNIKTINNESILGSGNIDIQGGGGGITSGEVQTMITSATTPIYQTIEDNEEVTAAAFNVLNAAVSGKASQSDLETISGNVNTISGQVANKQDTLVSGTNIKTINNQSILGSGNITIQGGSGGCTVDETIVFDNFGNAFYNWNEKYGLIRYANLSFNGNKATDTTTIYVVIGSNSSGYIYTGNITLDYPNKTASADTDYTQYLSVDYDNVIDDFAFTVSSSYPNDCIMSIQAFDGTINVPYITIESGDPCTVIEESIKDGFSKVRKDILECFISASFFCNEKYIHQSYNKGDGSQDNAQITLKELDGSNGVLKPNIQVPTGVSGYTELNTCEQGCCEKDELADLNSTKYRVTFTYDEQNVNYDDLKIYFNVRIKSGGYSPFPESQYISFTESGSSYIPTVDSVIYGGLEPSLEWNSSTKELVITYPATYVYNGDTMNVIINSVGSSNCHLGYNDYVSKVEYYGEFSQPLKPYIQETRAALGGLKLQQISQSDYENLPTKDSSTLYIII